MARKRGMGEDGSERKRGEDSLCLQHQNWFSHGFKVRALMLVECIANQADAFSG